MAWTDERIKNLRQLWSEGQSASKIAEQLGGVTRNAVIGKIHRLGLSNRKPMIYPRPFPLGHRPQEDRPSQILRYIIMLIREVRSVY